MDDKNYSIRIVKVPLGRKIKDFPARFPSLNLLELELVENKSLIKDGLPLIPLKNISRKPPVTFSVPSDDEDELVLPAPAAAASKRRVGVEELDEVQMGLASSDDEEIDIPTEDQDDEEEEEDEGEDEPPVPQLTPEQEEDEERQELLWKFRLLKKSYKDNTEPIPQFNEHSDVANMRSTYNQTVKSLSLDSALQQYQFYLIGGFILIEGACTRFFGLDMTDLTKTQTQQMNKYDRLLIELGEKNLDVERKQWPVEVRLIGIMLLNTAMFYIFKKVMGEGGGFSNLFGANGGKGGGGGARTEGTDGVKKSGGIRGPSISAEDIRRMSEEND